MPCLRCDSAARAIPGASYTFERFDLRTGGYIVVPDDFSRAAASDRWHLHNTWSRVTPRSCSHTNDIVDWLRLWRAHLNILIPDSKRHDQNYYCSSWAADRLFVLCIDQKITGFLWELSLCSSSSPHVSPDNTRHTSHFKCARCWRFELLGRIFNLSHLYRHH